MGVLHDVTNSGSITGSTLPFNIPLTIAANPNRYLLVHVFQWDSGSVPTSPTSVTWDGIAGTKLWEITGTQMRHECWGIPAPTAKSDNVVVTTTNSWTRRCAVASAYYNVDPTTPVSVPFTAAGSNAPLTTPNATNSWLLADGSGQNTGDLAVASSANHVGAASTNLLNAWIGRPRYRGDGTLGQAATGTSRAPAMVGSGVRGPGIVVMALVATKNNETHSCATSGWTKLDQWNGSGLTFSLWYTRQVGTTAPTAPTVTWATSGPNAGICFSLNDADPDNAPAQLLGSIGSGTVNNHETAGANAAFAASLAMYFDVAAANTALATPAGWTEDNDVAGATWIGRVAYGNKPLTNAGDASGAISIVGAVASWIQAQLEFKRSPAGAQVERFSGAIGSSSFFNVVNVCDEQSAAGHSFAWTGATGSQNALTGGVILKAAAITAITLLPTLHQNTQEFYAPRLKAAITASFHQNTQAFYAPKLSFTLKAPFHQNQQVFYGPSITFAPTPGFVRPPFFTNPQEFYGPTLRFLKKLTAPFHQNAQAFYGPTIVQSRMVLAPFHQNQQEFYAPTIRRLSKVQAPFHQNTQEFYGPTIIKAVAGIVVAPFFQNQQAFYGPTIVVKIPPPLPGTPGALGPMHWPEYEKKKKKRRPDEWTLPSADEVKTYEGPLNPVVVTPTLARQQRVKRAQDEAYARAKSRAATNDTIRTIIKIIKDDA